MLYLKTLLQFHAESTNFLGDAIAPPYWCCWISGLLLLQSAKFLFCHDNFMPYSNQTIYIYIFIVVAPVKVGMCTCAVKQLRIFQHQFIVNWFLLFENLCIIIVAKLTKKVTMSC